MEAYLVLMLDVLNHGKKRMDRTGTGTLSVFGRSLRFNMQEGFPLVTTKKIHFKSVVYELLWFLKGDRNMNVKYLQENGVRIWNEWADENGNLGPIYGAQWRNWPRHVWTGAETLVETHDGIGRRSGIDQLQIVIDKIKTNPTDRRLLVSAWNPSELDEMQLPPCHYSYQFYVEDGNLSCLVNQRSADVFLGVPFDIASYALLTHLVANVCDLGVGELIMNFGDTHIYLNHIDQVEQQLERAPFSLPVLQLKHRTSIDDFVYDDIKLLAYESWPAIKAEVSK